LVSLPTEFYILSLILLFLGSEVSKDISDQSRYPYLEKHNLIDAGINGEAMQAKFHPSHKDLASHYTQKFYPFRETVEYGDRVQRVSPHHMVRQQIQTNVINAQQMYAQERGNLNSISLKLNRNNSQQMPPVNTHHNSSYITGKQPQVMGRIMYPPHNGQQMMAVHPMQLQRKISNEDNFRQFGIEKDNKNRLRPPASTYGEYYNTGAYMHQQRSQNP
jgi:hypothetical protein